MSIIGIDIGTSGCKVCSFNSKGKLLSSSSRKYPEKQINGTREIKPDQVRDNVLDAFEETILKCPEPVQAIAVTCLGESLVCLDSDDHVLYPSMVTGDNRGQEGVDRLCESLGADYIFSITGLMPSQLYSLPKMIWMKDHTTVFQNTHKIFFYEDYIGYLLTGERKISYSSAARSMALDIHNLKWNEQLLSFANLTPKHFSEPVPSGTIIGYVKKELASRFHLTENVPVVAGGHDQACAAIGSGFINASIGEDCIGTCECLALMLPSEYDANTLKMLDMPCMIYPVGNAFFTTLEITTCGVLMNWARDNLFKGSRQICEAQKKDFFQYMDERIAGRKTEVLILPQFGSSGHPDLNYHMSACISGLTLETKEEDLYLALKESMIYQIKLASEYASPLNLTFVSVGRY